MMSMKNIERKRNGLNVVQCFFYSAVGCLVPYLSSHMREIGITKQQSAWITAIVSLISMVGPLCLGPIAYKYNRYKSTLVFALLLSFAAYTGLLFVPRVIRMERQPKIYFDCTSSVLRIEQCPNWEGQCHTYPKRPATNFSNFQLTSCTFECPQIGSLNMSWYPVHVCFTGSANEEGNLCLMQNHPDLNNVPLASKHVDANHNIEETISPLLNGNKNSIKFDTRFDRWPAIETLQDDIIERMFNGLPTCTYQPAPPLIVNQKLYDNLQCRPFVHNCNVYCSVEMQHRKKSSSGKEIVMRPPTPCTIETGDTKKTFYSYLAIRSLADLALFTAYTLLDALAIALTNDFDSIYGGMPKLWAIMIPLIAWPPICGQLVDFFSMASAPNYAPPIIVFDGLILITVFMVVAMPLNPTGLIAKSISQTIGQNAPFVKTKPYPRTHQNSKSALAIFIILFPLILILGTMWGLLETFLHPFYVNMGSNKLALGLTFTETFLTAAPFIVIAKSLINGVGRVHLIILAFIFYALRLAGISYLLYPRWLIVPFEMMESFSLPIAWIGITSYCHHLIKRGPSAASFASGAIFQKSSPHIILQYSLNIVHFGGGRALGAVIGGVWLSLWPEYHNFWYWLSDLDIDYADDHIIQDDAFRVLLRLAAIISASIGLIFLITYNICCCKSKIKVTKIKPQEESPQAVLNGNYSRLKDQSDQQAAIQLQTKPSQDSNQIPNQKKPLNGDTRIRMADEDDDELLLSK